MIYLAKFYAMDTNKHVLSNLFRGLNIPLKLYKKLSKTFVRDYLISMYSLMPYKYKENVDEMWAHVSANTQSSFVLRSNLSAYINRFGIDTIDYTIYNSTRMQHNERGLWRVLILPWLFITTNFNWDLLEEGFAAAYEERGSNKTRINGLTQRFIQDYLLRNTKYMHKNNQINMMINIVFTLFDDEKLYQYRKFLLKYIRAHYFEVDHVYTLNRFTEIESLIDVFDKNELDELKSEILSTFPTLNWYGSPSAIRDILENILKWNCIFSKDDCMNLEQFVLQRLKYRRNNLDEVVALIQKIETILKQYQYNTNNINHIATRKFTYMLASQ